MLPQRQTALAAKQIATIDLLSGGRLRVAVGAGWNHAEYEGLGAAFESRRDLLEEQVGVLRRLWSEPLVTFSGRFHQLDRVGINPLPARPIPIYLGSGAADAACAAWSGWPTGGCPCSSPVSTIAPAPRGRPLEPAVRGGWPRSGDTADPRSGVSRRGWQHLVEEVLEVGCADLSVGFNRLAEPGRSHDEHLDEVVAVKAELDDDERLKDD